MMKLLPARCSRGLRISSRVVRLAMVCLLGVISMTSVSAQTTDGVTFNPTFVDFQQQAIGTVSSPHSVSLINSTAADLTITGFSFAGSNPTEFSLTSADTCTGATLAVGANCVFNVQFSPNTTGSPSAVVIVSDSVGTQTVGLSGTVSSSVSETLNLQAAAGGSTSATVTAGNSATYNLSIGGASLTGSGFSGTVTITCSGAPNGSTCSVPGTETLSGDAVALTVTVSTTAQSGDLRVPRHQPTWMWAMGLLGFVLLPAAGARDMRRGSRRGLGLLAVLLCLLTVGCSGGGVTNSSSTSFTPVGTYALTITATSSVNSQAITQTLPLTLVVQ